MRRRSSEDADTLRLLFRAAREFARFAPRLSAHAVHMLLYIGTQPDETAEFGDVRRNCGLGQSQTSRLVATLVEMGWIVSTTPEDDGRRSVLQLSAKGRNVIGHIIQAAQSRR